MDSVGHVSLMFSILSESKGFSDYQGEGLNGDLQLRLHNSGSVILILLPAVGTPIRLCCLSMRACYLVLLCLALYCSLLSRGGMLFFLKRKTEREWIGREGS